MMSDKTDLHDRLVAGELPEPREMRRCDEEDKKFYRLKFLFERSRKYYQHHGYLTPFAIRKLVADYFTLRDGMGDTFDRQETERHIRQSVQLSGMNMPKLARTRSV